MGATLTTVPGVGGSVVEDGTDVEEARAARMGGWGAEERVAQERTI